jgi:hypothetical protein
MSEFIPPGYQSMIDWLDQPAPEFAGDTHALHFFLADLRDLLPLPVAYQGFMFFKEVRGGSHSGGVGALAALDFHNATGEGILGFPSELLFSLEHDLPSGGVGDGPRYFLKLQSETGEPEF